MVLLPYAAGAVLHPAAGGALMRVPIKHCPVLTCSALRCALLPRLTACPQEDEDFAQANQTASESFGNIRTIAAFGMEGQVGGAYEQEAVGPPI